jgi:hypothetical protein
METPVAAQSGLQRDSLAAQSGLHRDEPDGGPGKQGLRGRGRSNSVRPPAGRARWWAREAGAPRARLCSNSVRPPSGRARWWAGEVGSRRARPKQLSQASSGASPMGRAREAGAQRVRLCSNSVRPPAGRARWWAREVASSRCLWPRAPPPPLALCQWSDD